MGICLYEYFNLKYFDFVLELLKYEIDVNVLFLIKCFLQFVNYYKYSSFLLEVLFVVKKIVFCEFEMLFSFIFLLLFLNFNKLIGIFKEKDVGLGFFKINFGGIKCFNIFVGRVKGFQKQDQ